MPFLPVEQGYEIVQMKLASAHISPENCSCMDRSRDTPDDFIRDTEVTSRTYLSDRISRDRNAKFGHVTWLPLHPVHHTVHNDVKYDFTADLTGIGDRSVHEMSGL